MSNNLIWKAQPIFISSTFSDMNAERDVLRDIVTIDLQDMLNERRVRLEPIDFRWGIDTSDEKEKEQKELMVLKVCLEDIDRSDPFFIGLSGDRYGWVPPEKRMKDYPHQFSGGMRQRVMIAMALSCHPALLIADEPTTALDVTIQAQIIELMLRLKKEREEAAILLITHNLGVVAETCDRVIVMYGGKIQEIADVDALFEKPFHPYTEGLLSSLPNPDKPKGKLRAIPGIIPHILELPKGCKFATRCEKVFDKCWETEPELIEKEDKHFVRCHLFN